MGHIPPIGAHEIQPSRPMKMVGRGYPVIAGQSQIVAHGELAFINLGSTWSVIDLADFPIVAERKWSAVKKGRQTYVMSRRDYEAPKTTYLHRLILGAQLTQAVDHRDCDGLNNRRNNLRLCTQSENNKNLPLSVANTSGLKGAFFSKEKRRWYSQIRVNGKVLRLGYFATAEAAHAAYAQAAVKHHGEFARTA